MRDTKERILRTALDLFAREGYEAVSVSAIAGALGMTKGALYRHYESKRDIFDSILHRMEQRDAAQAQADGVPEGTAAEMGERYETTSMEAIVTFSLSMFRYWTEDPFAAAFRRLLTLEQYRSREMGALYQQYLASGPLDYVTDLFTALRLSRPREAAAAFYGPMFLLYSVYDGAEDRGETLTLLKRHLNRFLSDYHEGRLTQS